VFAERDQGAQRVPEDRGARRFVHGLTVDADPARESGEICDLGKSQRLRTEDDAGRARVVGHHVGQPEAVARPARVDDLGRHRHCADVARGLVDMERAIDRTRGHERDLRLDPRLHPAC
jgi:hypothetical protein